MPMYRVHTCYPGPKGMYADWCIYADSFGEAWTMWTNVIKNSTKLYNKHQYSLNGFSVDEIGSITVSQACAGFINRYGSIIKLTQEDELVSQPFFNYNYT